MNPPHPPLPRRDGLAPTQIALRELMILTRCYCDGEHPRLGHNCSFRPDVETVVAAVQKALALCNEAIAEGGPDPYAERMVPADEIRRLLLGWSMPRGYDPGPPWDNGNTTPGVSDVEGDPSVPG